MVLLVMIFLSACSTLPGAPDLATDVDSDVDIQLGQPPEGVPIRDYWPTEAWRSDAPENHGLDPALLEDMLDYIQSANLDVSGIIIVRHGYIVLEADYDPDQPRRSVLSCTKSVISALIGIAIQEGFIQDVHQPILDFFPELEIENVDDLKRSLTLEHLLMMASGMDSHDSWLYDWLGLAQMQASDDWVHYALNRPMIEPPGTRWEYSNQASTILSGIIQATTGMTAYDYAYERLFVPIGIPDVEWEIDPQGVTLGYKGLWMTPREMAKFGFLYLNRGWWEGQQILPAEWVEASQQDRFTDPNTSYGYQWWINPYLGYYTAVGYSDQRIFILSEQDMVVVITSSITQQDSGGMPEMLLTTYILPSVVE
jgi:CubicO group peptidase (beta-lactamase class C family)